jgi:hypothetical protein
MVGGCVTAIGIIRRRIWPKPCFWRGLILLGIASVIMAFKVGTGAVAE